jgi:hypothetical protein
MSDYTKSLEEQNEQLKQLLSVEQEKNDSLSMLASLIKPRWYRMVVPTRYDETDARCGYYYVYSGKLSEYARITWNSGFERWCTSWNCNIGPSDNCLHVDEKEAKEFVEKKFAYVVERSKNEPEPEGEPNV